MAVYRVRDTSLEVLYALVKAHNGTVFAGVTDEVHRAVSYKRATGDFRNPTAAVLAVASTNASDLPTLLVLCAEIKVVYAEHIRDKHAHLVADATNVVAAAEPTDLATAITFLNATKAAVNGHLDESGVHDNDDATNDVTSADADDLATAITLANEVKADINAHIIDAFGTDTVYIDGV